MQTTEENPKSLYLGQSKNTSRILQLPDFLINQIKAGEVIERPSNLLKEILENSLDANSTSISLNITNYGLDLIELIDNGIGMSFEDLPNAFKRHATSKIKSFADLFKLSSYGFRGEALASIASISKITCTSYPKENTKQGGKIELEGGKITKHIPLNGTNNPEYTTKLTIENLFYNTPVRLKFLKSKNYEKSQIKRVVDAFLLTWPEVSFEISYDNKIKKNFTFCQNETDFFSRIKNIFDDEKNSSKEVISLNESGGGSSVFGYIFIKEEEKSNLKQYIFVNKRMIIDRAIHQRIIYSLEKLNPSKKGIEYCIFIETPPEEIDVNVHPHKTFIKFEKGALIHSLLSQSIKNSFLKNEIPSLPSFVIPPKLGEVKNEFFPSSKSTDLKYNVVSELSKCFHFIISNNKKYILDTNNFLKETVLKFYQDRNFFEILDQDIFPLLISESLILSKIVPQEKLKYFTKIGIHIDHLDHYHYLVRSIPTILKDLPFLSFIEELVYYRDSISENKSLLQDFLNDKKITIFPNSPLTEVEEMLNKSDFSLDEMIKLKILTEITENLLTKLINE